MSTQIKNSTSEQQIKKRAQLDHLLLDADFFDKPKPRALIFKFGPISQLFLIRIYATLSRATNAEISLDTALGIAWELRIEEQAKSIIDFCIDQEMLLISSTGLITATRVIQDQERLYQTREKWKDRQGKSRVVVTRDTTVTPPETLIVSTDLSRVTLSKSVNTEILNTEDLNNKKENSQPVPPPYNLPPDEPPTDEADALALEKLESPQGKDWANSSVFMNTGRRPMKDYPEIWLSPPELADIIRDWQASNIPPDKWRKGFKTAQARLKTQAINGKPPQRTNVYNWLMGFGRNDLIEETIKDTRLQRVKDNANTYKRSN